MKKKFFCVLMMFCLVVPGVIRAQDTLPPEAQKAFDRGLIAVEQKQWDLAVKYFSEAQNSAKTNAQILFNLGLAHGKAGHELAAIAWLQAYVAVNPKAANAQAVRKEIARLDVAAEGKIAALVKLALDLNGKLERKIDREYLLTQVADLYGYVGDIGTALALKSANYPKKEVYAWSEYAEGLAFSGDFDGAKQAAAKVYGCLRGVLVGDVLEGACEIAGTCKNPANPDEYWDFIWGSIEGFYFNPPLEDYGLARQAAQQLKIPGARESYLKKIDEELHKAGNPMLPVERWASFAKQLSGESAVVNLDVYLKAHSGSPTDTGYDTIGAPRILMTWLYKLRALDRQFALQMAPAKIDR